MKATINGTPVEGTPEEIKRFKELCEGEFQPQDLTTAPQAWWGIYPPDELGHTVNIGSTKVVKRAMENLKRDQEYRMKHS